MRIQLDTSAKTIKVEGNVKFSELIETLEKLLPKGEWKKFTLETNVTINTWSNQIIIERDRPYRPWDYPQIWYETRSSGNTNTDYKLNSGTFNIEFWG